MRTLIASVAMLVLVGFAGAEDEKVDTKKLVGKWEASSINMKELGLTIEFTDKGKFILSIRIDDKTQKIEGTYKVDGNKLETESEMDGKKVKEAITILKLTDTELKIKDSKDGKEETLKRVKGK